MASGKSGKPASLEDLRDELRMANRLLIAHLAVQCAAQKDIAAVIGRTDSVVSEMFPKGLLRRLSKSGATASQKNKREV